MTYQIYKLIADADDGTDRFLCYIGCTTDLLSTRLANHECGYRRHLAGKGRFNSSAAILRKPYYTISLLEDLGDIAEADARIKEGEWIQKLQTDPDYIVLNKRVEGRDRSQYYIDNKQRYMEYQRAYSKRLESVQCTVCGKTYTRCNRSRHFKAHK